MKKLAILFLLAFTGCNPVTTSQAQEQSKWRYIDRHETRNLYRTHTFTMDVPGGTIIRTLTIYDGGGLSQSEAMVFVPKEKS